MIRLTDEEMMVIIARCEGTVKEARHEVNKAQLRKVVEWLIENDSVRGNHYDPWIINADLKQSLLEEVKDV